MIKIYPFKSIMPQSEKAAQIASEPYDVINAEEARQRAAGNEISFLHVVRPEIDFPPETDPYSADIYNKAAANIESLIREGHLQEQDQPGLFLYRQIFQGRQQYGIVCCYDVSQYRSGKIKKHEKTRPDKEDDRTRHITTCSAHAEPVFLAFKDDPTITGLIEQDSKPAPLMDFKASDGVEHAVWKVADADKYVTAFQEIDSVYIADGHHRTAAGERAATQRQSENSDHTGNEEYNRVLSVMFPSSHLKILAYNRVVDDLNSLDRAQVLEKLKEIGTVEPTTDPVPSAAGQICVYLSADGDQGKGSWYAFEFKADSIDHSDPIESLDVALLQSRILEPVLGIGDPRTDKRIGFVGGIRGTEELERLVDSGSKAIAFSMFPTSIEQLIDVSDAGEIMPPKSTWFEPKLRSGLFIHRFESY